jgi:hypothetical protein
MKFAENTAYLVGNISDETFDVQLSGTRFLTRSIGAFQTARRFPERRSFTQRRVLNVVKVFQQIGAFA